MLRAILGICGVSLITFGVFGGQMLENVHQGFSGLFTPDTVVVEASSKAAEALSHTTDTTVALSNHTGTSEINAPVAKAIADQLSPPVVVQEEKPALQIATATMVKDTPATPVPAVSVSADVLPTATAAVQKPALDNALGEAQDNALKEDGVAVVLSTTTGLPPNDTLFVLKDRVNMREGPSTGHAVVLELQVGQELMEFKREGKWVHVGAYGTSGKIGWVHNTLVGQQ